MTVFNDSAALAGAGGLVAKLTPTVERVSKLNAYAVLIGSSAKVSKLNAYAVLIPPPPGAFLAGAGALGASPVALDAAFAAMAGAGRLGASATGGHANPAASALLAGVGSLGALATGGTGGGAAPGGAALMIGV